MSWSQQRPAERERSSPSRRSYNVRYQTLTSPQRMQTQAGYMNATYHPTRDGNVSDSSSAEDLVIGANNGGVINLQEHMNDSDLLIAALPSNSSRHGPTRHRISLVVIALLLVLCLVLAALLFRKSTSHSKQVYCVSSGCIDATSFLQNAIDKQVDPCTDFYTFACGGWMKSNPIPDGKSVWGVDSVIWQRNLIIMRQALESNTSSMHGVAKESPNKMAHASDTPNNRLNGVSQHKSRVLYRSCMDDKQRTKRGAGPVKAIINDMGGFMSGSSNASGHVNFAKQFAENLIKAHKKYSVSPFFSTYVSADDHNSTYNIIKILQSGLAMLPVYYTKNSSSNEVFLAYKKYMVKIRTLLGDDEAASRIQMEEVLHFEVQLAKIFVAIENASDPAESYKKLSLASVNNMIPAINWVGLYKGIFDGVVTIAKDEPVVLESVSYFHKLNNVINSSPKHVLHNYIVWVAARSFVSYLTDDFLEAKKEMVLALQGAYEKKKRWKFCTSYVDGTMGLALGLMFVNSAFPGTSKQEASNMVEDIRMAFEDSLPAVQWMDESTKRAAADKAKAVMKKIGYPSIIMNQQKLDDKYTLLKPGESDFFANHLGVISFESQQNKRILRKRVDRTKWEMTAPQVNAYYNPTSNEIVFPAGILQPPYYSKDSPKSVNYGGIGAVIGHELLHGFDNTGRRYDKFGNSGKPWWSNSSVSSFEKRTRCYIDQYSRMKMMGKPVNGKMTLGENLADNGGLQAALRAYNRWVEQHGEESILPALGMTNLQVFFVSFAQSWCYNVNPLKALFWLNADVHSPNKDRVLGAISNSPEFSKAFQCPAGSPMNPANKCTMW